MYSLWMGEFARLLIFGEGGSNLALRYQMVTHRALSSERYRNEVVYRARPAVALSESVEAMRVPRSPPYPSVLDE